MQADAQLAIPNRQAHGLRCNTPHARHWIRSAVLPATARPAGYRRGRRSNSTSRPPSIQHRPSSYALQFPAAAKKSPTILLGLFASECGDICLVRTENKGRQKKSCGKAGKYSRLCEADPTTTDDSPSASHHLARAPRLAPWLCSSSVGGSRDNETRCDVVDQPLPSMSPVPRFVCGCQTVTQTIVGVPRLFFSLFRALALSPHTS